MCAVKPIGLIFLKVTIAYNQHYLPVLRHDYKRITMYNNKELFAYI